MVALILAAFFFSLQYLPLVLADTTLLPTLKFEAEPRNALIRGLIDREIDKRQYSYCPAPMYRCEYSHCCPNTNHPCCRGKSIIWPLLITGIIFHVGGTCCWPNTYCALASNGNIGCCPVGEVCSGPVNDPRTIFYTYTTTSTRTSTSEYTFGKRLILESCNQAHPCSPQQIFRQRPRFPMSLVQAIAPLPHHHQQ